MNIDDMHKLKNNWDSYGGDPINPKAIEMARTIMTVLSDFEAIPCGDGGVQLERHKDGEDIEIEIHV